LSRVTQPHWLVFHPNLNHGLDIGSHHWGRGSNHIEPWGVLVPVVQYHIFYKHCRYLANRYFRSSSSLRLSFAGASAPLTGIRMTDPFLLHHIFISSLTGLYSHLKAHHENAWSILHSDQPSHQFYSQSPGLVNTKFSKNAQESALSVSVCEVRYFPTSSGYLCTPTIYRTTTTNSQNQEPCSLLRSRSAKNDGMTPQSQSVSGNTQRDKSTSTENLRSPRIHHPHKTVSPFNLRAAHSSGKFAFNPCAVLGTLTFFVMVGRTRQCKGGVICVNVGVLNINLWKTDLRGRFTCRSCKLYVKLLKSNRPFSQVRRKLSLSYNTGYCEASATSQPARLQKSPIKNTPSCKNCGLHKKCHKLRRPVHSKKSKVTANNRKTSNGSSNTNRGGEQFAECFAKKMHNRECRFSRASIKSSHISIFKCMQFSFSGKSLPTPKGMHILFSHACKNNTINSMG
uniref:GATA-type domain-containing protein n=1 Tax=Oryzias latipes TaxID=8090 RepID=A0A3P9H0T9_ORYLA